MRSIQSLSTRELLSLLAAARRCGGRYYPSGEEGQGECLTVAELKAELATREHVPNKMESKLLRQQAARLSRGLGKAKRK